jgi:transcriptional regulator with XRE-family HTH domain
VRGPAHVDRRINRLFRLSRFQLVSNGREVCMEMSFGARLRQQREQQRVSLATIATETKIKMGLLEGLERDDISHWPGGIFRRSYLRAYAEAIGADADGVVREFLAIYPDPTDEVSAVEAMAQAGASRRPPTRLTYLISSAISALPSLRAHTTDKPPTPSGEPLALDEIPERASLMAPGFVLAPPMSGRPDGAPLPDAFEMPDSAQPLLDLGFEDVPFAPPRTDTLLLRQELDIADDTDLLVSEPLAAEGLDSDAPAPEVLARDTRSPDVVESRNSSRERAGDIAAASGQPGREREQDALPEGATYAFGATAELCLRLGRVCEAREVLPVLEDATSIVNAIGVILWTWDPLLRALRPALSHGYSAELLSQVTPVSADSDNAIGSAFRSAETRVVSGDDHVTGALAVPLMTPSGCAGVLAAEFRDSIEQVAWVRAVVTILAAQLSMLVGPPAALRVATA